MTRPAAWHLYVVETADGALYAGISTDPHRRLAEHRAAGSRAARSLRGRAPLRLVYVVRLAQRGLALRAEHAFKRLPRTRKLAVVRQQPDAAGLLAELELDRGAG